MTTDAITYNAEKNEENLWYVTRNTTPNYLTHVKCVMITVEKKMKNVKELNLKMNSTGWEI